MEYSTCADSGLIKEFSFSGSGYFPILRAKLIFGKSAFIFYFFLQKPAKHCTRNHLDHGCDVRLMQTYPLTFCLENWGKCQLTTRVLICTLAVHSSCLPRWQTRHAVYSLTDPCEWCSCAEPNVAMLILKCDSGCRERIPPPSVTGAGECGGKFWSMLHPKYRCNV